MDDTNNNGTDLVYVPGFLNSGAKTSPTNPSPTPTPPSGTSPSQTIDPAVVLTAMNEGPLSTVPAFASVVMHRAQTAGITPSNVVAEGAGTSSVQFPGFSKNNSALIGTPQYNQYASALSPYISGQVPLPYSFDSYRAASYKSPDPNHPWNGNAPLTNIGGNNYATLGTYKYSGSQPQQPTDLVGGLKPIYVPPADTTPVDQNTPGSQGIVYDPNAGGGTGATRFTTGPRTGDIAAVGDITKAPAMSQTGVPMPSGGGLIDPKTLIGLPSSPFPGEQFAIDPRTGNYIRPNGQLYHLFNSTNSGPTQTSVVPTTGSSAQAIADFKQDNPDDPSNHLTSSTPQVGDDSIGNIAKRVALGPFVGNPTSLDLGISQGLKGSTLGTLSDLIGAIPNTPNSDAKYYASQLLVQRLQNDAVNGQNVAYNEGKMTGEAIPSVAAGLATGGAADAFLGPELAGYLGGTLGRANIIPKLMTSGAVQGAESGAISTGDNNNPFLSNVEGGSLSGAALGGVLPVATQFGKSAIQNIASGASKYGIDPALANLGLSASGDYKIPIRVTQMIDSNADNKLLNNPATSFANNNNLQDDAWRRAVAGTHGEVTDTSTDPLGNARNAQYNLLSEQAKSVTNTPQDYQNIQQASNSIRNSLKSLVNIPGVSPSVMNKISSVGNDVADGLDSIPQPWFDNNEKTIPVSDFSNLFNKVRANGGDLDNLINSTNPLVQTYGRNFRNQIDNIIPNSDLSTSSTLDRLQDIKTNLMPPTPNNNNNNFVRDAMGGGFLGALGGAGAVGMHASIGPGIIGDILSAATHNPMTPVYTSLLGAGAASSKYLSDALMAHVLSPSSTTDLTRNLADAIAKNPEVRDQFLNGKLVPGSLPKIKPSFGMSPKVNSSNKFLPVAGAQVLNNTPQQTNPFGLINVGVPSYSQPPLQ